MGMFLLFINKVYCLLKHQLKKVIFSESVICFSTRISPLLNTQLRSFKIYGKLCNLHNPQTFVEKLLYLKLKHYKDKKYVQCADKYAVRQYVKDVGCSDILNELYGVYNTIEEIPDYAFYASSLYAISIPSSVTKIGRGVFEASTQLEIIQLNN